MSGIDQMDLFSLHEVKCKENQAITYLRINNDIISQNKIDESIFKGENWLIYL